MTKLTKNEKLLREATSKWNKFLKEGAFTQEETLEEARMGEYGKMDAEQGLPPTKIGRGNEEYMAAYNAVMQKMGKEPVSMEKPDQAYLDALRSGQLEENEKKKFEVGEFVYIIDGGLRGATGEIVEPTTLVTGEQGYVIRLYSDADKKVFGKQGDEVIAGASVLQSGATRAGMELYDIDEKLSAADKEFHKSVMNKGKVPNLKGDMGPLPGLEGPFQYRSGAVLYYDPKAGAYYDRGKDMYLDREEAARLTMENNPSSFATRVTHSSDPEMDQVMDIAADMLELGARSRIPVSLVGVEMALQKQGFDTEMQKGKLIVDDKYVIAAKDSLPDTAQKISFTKYAADYLSNIEGEQLDLPME
jgi:hypothetical protein